jgi:hypothetical protein
MKPVLQAVALMASVSLFSAGALSSPEIDQMSDIEVSEYAVRMASVIEGIENRQLCVLCDVNCERSEFARHGISYDDKESVKKRLALMIGSIY